MIQTKYDYESLLQKFLDGQIAPTEFAITYIDKIRDEWDEFDEETYDILEYMFTESNDFTDDPELFNENPDQYIDEAQFRKSAAETLEKFRALKRRRG